MHTCIKAVVSVNCNYCEGQTIKFGKAANGAQSYRCKTCFKTQLAKYLNIAHKPSVNSVIAALLKEGCGIRGIARLLAISAPTVIKRIKSIAGNITKPVIPLNRTYELDELKTYVKTKARECWVAYALDKESGQVIDFRVGRRNKSNLKVVCDTLLLAGCKQIYTDILEIYRHLMPGILQRGMASIRSNGKILHCGPT